jgi:glycerate 2-kinase
MIDEAGGPGVTQARERILRMFSAALAAVDPVAAVRSAIAYEDRTLAIGDAEIVAPRGIHVVAVGKAAVAMTSGALEAIGEAIVSGDVITKEGHAETELPARIRVWEAGHPVPDERGVRATTRALAALAGLEPGVVVLALISGGGSALLEAPRDGVTLADVAATTRLLLHAGAPIEDLNAVRAPLSRVKGGGLRAAAPDATWATLVLSDVLGNDPRVIASGPTVTGANSPAMALATLDRYGLREGVPEAVRRLLENAQDGRDVLGERRDVVRIIGDNAVAIEAAMREGHAMGLAGDVLWRGQEGEAAELGRTWVSAVAGASPGANFLLGGGEATVTVRGAGRGGRNTEFALAAALELERRGLIGWSVGSLATDGQDALTGAAGAIVDAGTAARARAAGVDPAVALSENDSLTVFEAAGGLVVTGPTNTNVNDLYVAMREGD